MSSEDVYLGAVFQFTVRHWHRIVVISDLKKTGEDLLFVKLTTLRDSWVDDACILDQEDYKELTHKTTVAYSTAQIATVSWILDAIDNGMLALRSDLSSATLQKILIGAQKTRELSPKKIALICPPSTTSL